MLEVDTPDMEVIQNIAHLKVIVDTVVQEDM
jgi:hypothetical protein